MLQQSLLSRRRVGRFATAARHFRYTTRYDPWMTFSIELEREDDGRWIAEALEIPGVMCYGTAREEAIGNTERLANEVIGL
jgi:hypothetical protein